MNTDHVRVIRFIIIGILSTGFYFGLLYFLRPVIFSTAVLAAVCYLTSMVFNFAAQGLWTFGVTKLTRQNLQRYFLVQGAALIINSIAMAFLVDYLALSLYMSQVGVTTLVTCGIFQLMRNWVYS
jgi:putative flippase GtrA